ncbi:MAG TPA: hypothetical protein VGC95_08135, partial [Chitinophagaceae bacterium]
PDRNAEQHYGHENTNAPAEDGNGQQLSSNQLPYHCLEGLLHWLQKRCLFLAVVKPADISLFANNACATSFTA